MPKQKQKTHKGIAKRIKLTAKKKLKYGKPGAGHLMSVKNAKRRRRIGTPGILHSRFALKIKHALDVG
jgi:large subunit ribosomal protein L35